MTEKEKRTLGLLYDNNYDPELAAELSACKDLCYACNQIPPSHLKERQEAFRKIFGKTGAHFLIQPAFWCDYGYNIEIGENFYANHNCVILDDAKVVFGDQCIPRTKLHLCHRRPPAGYSAAPIRGWNTPVPSPWVIMYGSAPGVTVLPRRDHRRRKRDRRRKPGQPRHSCRCAGRRQPLPRHPPPHRRRCRKIQHTFWQMNTQKSPAAKPRGFYMLSPARSLIQQCQNLFFIS